MTPPKSLGEISEVANRVCDRHGLQEIKIDPFDHMRFCFERLRADMKEVVRRDPMSPQEKAAWGILGASLLSGALLMYMFG